MKTQKERKISKLNLPVTYRELFLFTYKSNWLLLLKLSLLITVFALPLFLALFIEGGMETTIINGRDIVSDVAARKDLLLFRGTYGFVILICLMVFSLGLAGGLNVIHRFAHLEGCSLFRDFFKGIKTNGLWYALYTLIYGIVIFGFNYLLNLLYTVEGLAYYPFILIIFVILTVILTCVYIINLNAWLIYKCSFFRQIKNSFLIFISNLPLVLFELLITFAPLAVTYFIGNGIADLICFVIYMGIGFGNSMLVIILINSHIFDRVINKTQYPEIYRKGLFNKDEEKEFDEGFVSDDFEI
ncbi:MAG: hypothetical protein HUJ59_00045 [Bacilli bacterium]|nr:hypothetical protein [Bacilli bacterium]